MITKMEEQKKLPDCNPIKLVWQEMGRAVDRMVTSPVSGLTEI